MLINKKSDFKAALYVHAVELITQRINNASAAMQNAQAAANEEEKSSAGDKYETSRAMQQINKEMYARQLAENKKELQLLRSVNVELKCEQVTAGALIACDDFFCFIAAGLGKIIFRDETIYFLSPHAPLAISLLNKKHGDVFLFNGRDTRILSIL